MRETDRSASSSAVYRLGGGTRLAGCMLAAATAGVMFAGPSVIGFLPVMVVAALIFVLGIDLVKEVRLLARRSLVPRPCLTPARHSFVVLGPLGHAA